MLETFKLREKDDLLYQIRCRFRLLFRLLLSNFINLNLLTRAFLTSHSPFVLSAESEKLDSLWLQFGESKSKKNQTKDQIKKSLFLCG